jgi:hypothetical protein
MQPEHFTGPIPDTRPLHSLVRRTRACLRGGWVATGFALAVSVGCGLLVLIGLADAAAPFSSALRLLGLLLTVVPTVWVVLAGVLRPLCRRLSSKQVARRIEEHLPGIHNRLVSVLDLEGDRSRSSSAFYRRLVDETVGYVASFRTGTLIDVKKLRHALLVAAGAVAAIVVAIVLLGERFTTALARLAQPFADIPPVSGIAYAIVAPEPGGKVLRGDDVAFTVEARKGQPDDLILEARGDGEPLLVRQPFRRLDDGRWGLVLSTSGIGLGADRALHYRVRGGGTWTREQEVRLVDRPLLLGLSAAVHYPAYMGMTLPRPNPPQVADVTGPEDSRIEVAVRAEGDVREAEIQFLERRWEPIEPEERVERVWFEDRPPTGATAEGQWLWGRWHGRAAHTEPPFKGPHGHVFRGATAGFPVGRDDMLFAYVYLPPEHPPRSIVLRWFEDSGAEHRASWGEHTSAGEQSAPDQGYLGALPQFGTWVRLEVRAARVDLEGKTLRGMSFGLTDGECYWHRAGAIATGAEALVPASRLAMSAEPEGCWIGSFPLRGQGLYRVELRNELKVANKPMKEAVFQAVADQPPEIVLDRPGNDVVLVAEGSVPLVIAAHDDFGLADVSIEIQRQPGADWESLPVRRYDKPCKSDTITAVLGHASMPLPGGTLRYRAKARDCKGQIARTREYAVRLDRDAPRSQQDAKAESDARERAAAQPLSAVDRQERERQRQQAVSTARDLQELRDYLARLRQDLRLQEGRQEKLAAATQKSADQMLEQLEKQQGSLDRQTKNLLERAGPFRGPDSEGRSPEARRSRESQPPGEQTGKSSPDPATSQKSHATDQSKSSSGSGSSHSEGRREQLQAHQSGQLEALRQAQRDLKLDEQGLSKLLERLAQQAQAGSGRDTSPGGQPTPSQGAGTSASDAAGAATSAKMHQALEMAARLREMRRAPGGPAGPRQADSPGTVGNLDGSSAGEGVSAAQWGELDLKTREALLRMQPRERDELLQSLHEQAPDGYRRLIDEYFKRLTDAQSPGEGRR